MKIEIENKNLKQLMSSPSNLHRIEIEMTPSDAKFLYENFRNPLNAPRDTKTHIRGLKSGVFTDSYNPGHLGHLGICLVYITEIKTWRIANGHGRLRYIAQQNKNLDVNIDLVVLNTVFDFNEFFKYFDEKPIRARTSKEIIKMAIIEDGLKFDSAFTTCICQVVLRLSSLDKDITLNKSQDAVTNDQAKIMYRKYKRQIIMLYGMYLKSNNRKVFNAKFLPNGYNRPHLLALMLIMLSNDEKKSKYFINSIIEGDTSSPWVEYIFNSWSDLVVEKHRRSLIMTAAKYTGTGNANPENINHRIMVKQFERAYQLHRKGKFKSGRMPRTTLTPDFFVADFNFSV